jgi:glycosyltransferase involved in cell wall biosynthesis
MYIVFMFLSIIIPAYNEIRTIGEILQKVFETPYDKEIIIVDDGSKDGTREYLTRLKEKEKDKNIKIIFHEKNMGKGASIRTGISAATGDIILIQDADLEYDPREYPKLLAPIKIGRAHV